MGAKLITPDQIKEAAELAGKHARERAEVLFRHGNELRILEETQRLESEALATKIDGSAALAPQPQPPLVARTRNRKHGN